MINNKDNNLKLIVMLICKSLAMMLKYMSQNQSKRKKYILTMMLKDQNRIYNKFMKLVKLLLNKNKI